MIEMIGNYEWNGFHGYRLSFEEREGILILPPDGKSNRHWLLKTEYWDAFPNAEIEMVKNGYHLAFLQGKNRVGTTDEIMCKVRFAEALSKQFDLAEKCIPVGMSCGGLQAIKFAGMRPDLVSILYLDAPVVNFLSWPFGFGDCEVTAGEKVQKELLTAYGMTQSELLSFREAPLDYIPVLVANRIPVVLVYGDSDHAVPYPENGYLIEKAYKASETPLFLFGKKGCGHHPHGLPDPKPITDLLITYDNGFGQTVGVS